MSIAGLVYMAAGVVAIFAILGAIFSDARNLAAWARGHRTTDLRTGPGPDHFQPLYHTPVPPPVVAGSPWHAVALAAVLGLFLLAAVVR